jgi:hypothetical protein
LQFGSRVGVPHLPSRTLPGLQQGVKNDFKI